MLPAPCSAAPCSPLAAAPTTISAIACPTCTVSSGSTSSFVIVPAAGAGTSASILSVETSITVSPSATAWPSATCHSRIVPSVTDSPISGIEITSVSPGWSAPVAADGPASGSTAVVTSPGSAESAPTESAPRSWSPSPPLVTRPSVSCSGDGSALAPLPELAVPLGSILASTWPTSTVSSGWARMLVTTPLAGAGTSASILSVETSTTVSPSATSWPSETRHSRIVPSVTDSPIWGIWTSTTPASAISFSSAAGAASNAFSSLVLSL